MGVRVPHGLAAKEAAVITRVASPDVSGILHAVNAEHCVGKNERE